MQQLSTNLSRRHVALAVLAAPFIWTGARAQPLPQRLLTPSQAEGPFYPVTLPKDMDSDLLRNGGLTTTQGQACTLAGTITNMRGEAVRGAQVEIWQCDHAGRYDHPGDGGRIDPAFQGFGRATVDADGRYRFRTIRPVPYSGRTPHIHVKVKLGQRELLTTQLYVAGEPGNERDFLWRRMSAQDRTALTQPFAASSDGPVVQFPIVVAA